MYVFGIKYNRVDLETWDVQIVDKWLCCRVFHNKISEIIAVWERKKMKNKKIIITQKRLENKYK